MGEKRGKPGLRAGADQRSRDQAEGELKISCDTTFATIVVMRPTLVANRFEMKTIFCDGYAGLQALRRRTTPFEALRRRWAPFARV
jgi:hypothetical protein